ncbi:MAG: peptidoglycan DD-metalloendopeptidase family protein [Eubacteriales bacterium]|jgi:hypothetical protein|nr:peptidoglycan DD-metalloendopeptidase family protein [Clostridiales bacterium]
MAKRLLVAAVPVTATNTHYITSPYGIRTVTVKGKTSTGMHNGIDLVAGRGTDYIVAYESGIVTYARGDVTGNTPSEGNSVYIDHGNGFKTYYFHMKPKSVLVKAGDLVRRGQKIGYMGTTGNSTGAHLHFGIKFYNAWVDPEPYLTGLKNMGGKRMTITLRTLSQGMRGEDVKTLQQLLNAKINTSLEPDGKFGPLTNTALKKYQAASALVVDGKCGPATWSKLLGV